VHSMLGAAAYLENAGRRCPVHLPSDNHRRAARQPKLCLSHTKAGTVEGGSDGLQPRVAASARGWHEQRLTEGPFQWLPLDMAATGNGSTRLFTKRLESRA
jgi:hypothetical protein